MSAFTNLTTVTGDFHIATNDALTSMPAFTNLATVDYFLIDNNDALTSIPVFTNLTTVGEFRIQNNAVLTSVSGFASLTTITRSFTIQNNTNLTTISGFASIPLVATNPSGLYINQSSAEICLSTKDNLNAYFSGSKTIAIFSINNFC